MPLHTATLTGHNNIRALRIKVVALLTINLSVAVPPSGQTTTMYLIYPSISIFVLFSLQRLSAQIFLFLFQRYLLDCHVANHCMDIHAATGSLTVDIHFLTCIKSYIDNGKAFDT